jgi:hypothetical protein
MYIYIYIYIYIHICIYIYIYTYPRGAESKPRAGMGSCSQPPGELQAGYGPATRPGSVPLFFCRYECPGPWYQARAIDINAREHDLNLVVCGLLVCSSFAGWKIWEDPQCRSTDQAYVVRNELLWLRACRCSVRLEASLPCPRRSPSDACRGKL